VEWWNDIAWPAISAWWLNDGWPWLAEWMKAPGFAALAAVLAAAIAYLAARNQARLNAWWQRMEWALGLYAQSDSSPADRVVGLAAIQALQKSRLARKPEQDFVAAIVDAVTLDPLGDGAQTDDWADENMAEEQRDDEILVSAEHRGGAE
jgi:hypothetical protein